VRFLTRWLEWLRAAPVGPEPLPVAGPVEIAWQTGFEIGKSHGELSGRQAVITQMLDLLNERRDMSGDFTVEDVARLKLRLVH
jgi:hypothetical protein